MSSYLKDCEIQKDDERLAHAEQIAQKNGNSMVVIALFAAMWAAIIAAAIVFYANAQSLFLIIIIAGGMMIALCIWETITFMLTPKQPVRRSDGGIFFWSANKWRYLAFESIDEVRTNGQNVGPYTSMRTILDRGGLRIFDKHNNLYRIKFLKDPLSVKADIDEAMKGDNKE